MTTNRVLRLVRTTILSSLVALAALSFLVIGIANAQTANSSTTTTVQIVDNSQGQAVFSPNTITVRDGTHVTIVNHTKVRQIVLDNDPIVFLNLAPGASASIVPLIFPEQLKIYGSAPSSLLINLSPQP